MKYKLSRVLDLIKKCDTLVRKYQCIRDTDPSKENHDAVIFILNKRLSYVKEIEKYKRRKECCVLN